MIEEKCSCEKFFCPENIEICPCRTCLVRPVCTETCEERYEMARNNTTKLKIIELNVKVIEEKTR